MRYVAHLSGEHEELPVAELEAVLAADGRGYELLERGDRYAVFESDPVDFGRLAMTDAVGAVIASSTGIEEIVPDELSVDGSFAVRCHVFEDAGDWSTAEVEETVGAAVAETSGAPVDLDEPDTLFNVYMTDGTVYLCRSVATIDTGQFEDRRNHLRPFSSPVSLHPRLARTLVNLSRVPADGAVLDPLCGTGGVLIEAGLLGCAVYGSDLSQEMVEGCRQNLGHYGVDGDIRQGAVADLDGLFDRRFDVVVADLPYGRASKKQGEKEELYRTFLAQAKKVCDGRVVFVADMEDVAGLEPRFSVYVHGSLSRYIYVVAPGTI